MSGINRIPPKQEGETRLEKAVKNFIDRVTNIQCPGHYGVGPMIDRETAITDIDHAIGCRGITCEQCWNT